MRYKEQFQEMLVDQRKAIEEMLSQAQAGKWLEGGEASDDLGGASGDELSPTGRNSPLSPGGTSRRNTRRRTGRVSQLGPDGNPIAGTELKGAKSEITGEKKDMEEVFDELVKDNKIMAQPAHRKVLKFLHLDKPLDQIVGVIRKLHFVPSPIKRACAKLDGHDWFEMGVLIAILLNCCLIAWSASDNMRRTVKLYRATPFNEKPVRENLEEQSIYITAGDFLFAVLFSMELVIRFCAEEGLFFVGRNYKWNALDIATVTSNWMECYLSISGNEASVEWTWIRVFRLVRVLRTLRLARIMILFRELRLVLLCLAGSLMPLLWALAVFCSIQYLFAVIILQGVASFLMSNPRDPQIDPTGLEQIDDSNAEYLTKIFFSFPRTFLTLFQSVTGGEDWGVVQQQLEKADLYYGMMWVLYISIMFFGVLNVITGIFVETAVSRARNDRDSALQAELAKNKDRLRQILNLFTDVDSNEDGKITLEEWENFASSNEAKTYMALLGLDMRKTHELFELIDFDGNHEVSLQEFAIGCMQLQGPPKGVDIETLLRNSKKVMKKVTELFETVEERLELAFEDQAIVQDRVLEFLDKLEFGGHRRLSAGAVNPTGGSSADIASSEMIAGITAGTSTANLNISPAARAALPISGSGMFQDSSSPSPAAPLRPQGSNLEANKATEKRVKAAVTRQKLEKRTMDLLRLGDELVAPEIREEFRSAVAVVIRDMQAQHSWSSKAARSAASELDSLSIRYGLYHHEQREAAKVETHAI